MKKRVWICCILFTLLFAAPPAQARPIMNFFQRTRYGQLAPYENLVYHYAIDIYEGFRMYSEEQLDQIWATTEFEEGEDIVYDFRLWASPDQNYHVEIQVKEQTYASFEEEVAKAPDYITQLAPAMKEKGYTNIRQLHEGILRQTPEGEMLEIAYAMTAPLIESAAVDIITVYYDCYYEDVEYVFSITAYNGDYETAQSLLDTMIQTVRITPSGRFI